MDSIILLDAKGKKRLVPVEQGMLRIEGLGVIDSSKLLTTVGKTVTVAGKRFLVLTATALDHIECIKRGAQIVVAKDSASIVQRCDLRAGDLVIEGGAGSGALTIALAHAVSPNGRVVSYELREDFASIVRKNLSAAGLDGIAEVKVADVYKGMSERGAKAVILDLPEPWKAVKTSWDALAPCGTLASYSPTVEQVKETVKSIKELPFTELRTTEIIEREIEVKDSGVRPAFAPLGHTGYITTSRKVLESL